MGMAIPTSSGADIGKCPVNNSEVSESLIVALLDFRVLNFVTSAFFQHGF